MKEVVETGVLTDWGMASAGLLTTTNHGDLAFDHVARVFVETECVSLATRRAYLGQLVRGAKMLGVNTVTEIKLGHLMLLKKMIMDAEASPSTKGQFMAAWRTFMKWRCLRPAHRISVEDIEDILRAPKARVIRPYDVLSRAEIVKMVESAGNLRDRGILLVMLGAGLRVSEVVGLDCRDVRLDGDGEYFLLIHGKGRKDRQVPVHQEVVDGFHSYLGQDRRSLNDEGPLFLAHDRARSRRPPARMTTRALGLLITTLTKACGIHGKNVSPHALRHTYAIGALRQGGNVVAVAKLLGHAQVSTTQRYLDHSTSGKGPCPINKSQTTSRDFFNTSLAILFHSPLGSAEQEKIPAMILAAPSTAMLSSRK